MPPATPVYAYTALLVTVVKVLFPAPGLPPDEARNLLARAMIQPHYLHLDGKCGSPFQHDLSPRATAGPLGIMRRFPRHWRHGLERVSRVAVSGKEFHAMRLPTYPREWPVTPFESTDLLTEHRLTDRQSHLARGARFFGMGRVSPHMKRPECRSIAHGNSLNAAVLHSSVVLLLLTSGEGS